MQPNHQAIERKLRGAWRRERRFFHTRGLCHALLWIVGLFLFDLALDWLLQMPGWARLALLGSNLAILGWVAYHAWWQNLRRYDAVRMSLAVERLHPDLKSLLVSFVQLQPGCEDPAIASPQLIEALRCEAVRTTSSLSFLRVVDFRRLRKLLLTTVAVLSCFGLSSLLVGEFYRVLAFRLTDPGATLSYPTRTRITEITGDVTVRQGDPLGLSVAAEGEVPEEAVLQIRYGDGPWERVRVPGDESGRFAYQASQTAASFLYRFRVGDATSERHRVDVIPAPQMVESLVRLRFPKYTALPEQEIKTLNVEVLEGTEVSWEVRCDQALSSAAMICDPGREAPMTIDSDDPQVARVSMKAEKSLAYQFRWTEREHGYAYTDAVRYSLRVTTDDAPLVELLPPLPEEKGTLNKTLTLRFRARDTYGLTDAWIVYSINGEPEQERAAGLLAPGQLALGEVQWRPRDTIPNLKEDYVLTYAIKVRDNHSGDRGPNAGRSKSYRLQFLSRDEYLHYVQETKDELFARVKGVQEDENESSNTVKALKTETKP